MRTPLPLFALLSTSLLTGCLADQDADGDEDADIEGEAASPITSEETAFHVMPLLTPQPPDGDTKRPTPHLHYYGGPVLKHVQAFPVFWNDAVAFRSNLNAFYAAVPRSDLFDLLDQYSGIGRGTGHRGVTDTRKATKVSDAAIHRELNRLFAAGTLPAPGPNSYYPVHFPAGVTITAPDGSQSCVQFCAYHGTYKRNGVNVYYGVMPDQGGGCAGGCGANSHRVNNLFSVSSHELVEAVTDPAVGLATSFGPPLAWYDQRYGEIGDICNGQQGTVVGGDGKSYVVQKEWSNAAKRCVVQ